MLLAAGSWAGVGVDVVALLAAGHGRIEAVSCPLIVGQGDAGRDGAAFDGVPGDRVSEVAVFVAVGTCDGEWRGPGALSGLIVAGLADDGEIGGAMADPDAGRLAALLDSGQVVAGAPCWPVNAAPSTVPIAFHGYEASWPRAMLTTTATLLLPQGRVVSVLSQTR